MHRLLGTTLACLLVIYLATFEEAEALSCFCGTSPCEVPQCCESGSYVTDSCGCCPVCSKPQSSPCGGPWRTSGLCGEGLKCFRQCECTTEIKKQDCIFPFTYKGKTYNNCTKDNSENGKAWCAIEVDNNGQVIKDRWDDCQEGCPGTDFECDEGFLFNIEGRCVADSFARTVTPQTQALAFQFDDTDSVTFEPAPACDAQQPVDADGFREPECRCAKNIVGSPGGRNGGCVPPPGSNPDFEDDFSYGWCFLEYVSDPENPQKNCYDDVVWSATEGRFWSNKACKPGARPGKNNGGSIPVIFEE